MRRTLAAPGLAAVLGMALLLTACGKTNAHNNTAGETVSTALFDFSITDVSLVESYPGRADCHPDRADRYPGRDPDHPGYPGDHSDQYSGKHPD